MGRNLFLFFFSLVLVASSRLGIYQSRKERWSFSTNIILSMNSSKLFRASRNRISNPFKRGRIIARIVLFFDYSTIIYYPFLGGKTEKKKKEKKILLTGRNLCSARCKGRSRSGVRVIEETIFLKEVRRVEKYILDGVLTSSKSDGDKILFKL